MRPFRRRSFSAALKAARTSSEPFSWHDPRGCPGSRRLVQMKICFSYRIPLLLLVCGGSVGHEEQIPRLRPPLAETVRHLVLEIARHVVQADLLVVGRVVADLIGDQR